VIPVPENVAVTSLREVSFLLPRARGFVAPRATEPGLICVIVGAGLTAKHPAQVPRCQCQCFVTVTSRAPDGGVRRECQLDFEQGRASTRRPAETLTPSPETATHRPGSEPHCR